MLILFIYKYYIFIYNVWNFILGLLFWISYVNFCFSISGILLKYFLCVLWNFFEILVENLCFFILYFGDFINGL